MEAVQDKSFEIILHNCAAMNAIDAWALGVDGVIFRTDNGGHNWKSQKLDKIDIKEQMMHLSFAGTQYGWAGGLLGSLYRTIDGGRSWEKIVEPGNVCTIINFL